ncbi:MAG: histidine phosphatase family protein [Planctomycetota bacterium]|jgi:probable phosphoglycerate mutase
MTSGQSLQTARFGGHEHEGGRRVWLIRHGETTGNSSVRYYGATDVPLSDVGREQVRRLAPVLVEQRFAALVHSPLSRAEESARIVLGALRHAPSRVEPEHGLREVDFGELEGLTSGEIAADRPDFHARWQRGEIEGYPGGETIAGFRARVAAGMDAVLARHPEGDLCVVAHRGIVKNAIVHLLGLPWELVRTWCLDLGSATVLVESERGFVLDRYNLVAPS